MRSSDNMQLFADNRPWTFKVNLDRPLQLAGVWSVALTEITITSMHTKKQHVDSMLYVFCNICSNTLVGVQQVPILRSIYLDDVSHHSFIFSSPYYMPIKVGMTQQIHIYLKDEHGNDAVFIDGEVFYYTSFKKTFTWFLESKKIKIKNGREYIRQ